MLDQLTHESFDPLVGQTFKVTHDGQTLDFELVEVEPLPVGGRRSRRAQPKRLPFALFFTAQLLLPQATYSMQHDAFGPEPLPIFIVPVGEVEGDKGYEYEAVFT